ncbi:MAG: hypothetical protein KAJ29_01895 [Alphaproteobacteria bacterium]|nr:hypothetical protein [Alphaproteobacteria bacterium]
MRKACFEKAIGSIRYADQRGNILFLILVAVALFAALFYAVRPSSDDDSNVGSNKIRLINSAKITQYPVSVSMKVVGMISSGVPVNKIRFNRPSNDEFDNLDSTDIGVFHPDGGNATYDSAPENVMADGQPGEWVFNAELEVPGIGLTGLGGNDIIAYLVGLKKRVCLKINEEYGIGSSTIPKLKSCHLAKYKTRMYDDGSNDYEMPGEDVPDIDDGTGSLNGQPFGCFQDGGDGDYVYYHVILER